MVKKLFKHEMQYYIRSLLPVFIVLGGVALIGRFIAFFEAETTAYTILRVSSVTMLIISSIAAIGMSLLFCIIRFYKNLFTGEGYLTMTLPVTSRAHILVKLAAALIANLAAVLAVIVAVCIFTLGDWLIELIKAGVYIWKDVAANFDGHFGWYVLEAVPMLLMAICMQLMLYYMCICVGQLARKNRVIAAVGVYFGLYVITQIISTILVVIVSISNIAERIGEFLEGLTKQEMLSLGHWMIWGMFAFFGLMAVVYYAVSKHIMTKRLNLE